MNTTLTMQEKLKDLRVEKGLTLDQLAEMTGISRSALGKYESDDLKDISPFNLVKLAKIYGVSTDYLLGLSEQKDHPNTPIETLHLDDETIKLLQNEIINNRLLCELMKHELFKRLMQDMEIYVDGRASLNLRNLNAALKLYRHEITTEASPREDDLHMREMAIARIAEDDYFGGIIKATLFEILHDIREAHEKDPDTADKEYVVENMASSMLSSIKSAADPLEGLFRFVCGMLQIPYEDISFTNKLTILNLLKKSKLVQSPTNKRGKKSRFKFWKKDRKEDDCDQEGS